MGSGQGDVPDKKRHAAQMIVKECDSSGEKIAKQMFLGFVILI